MHAYAYFLAVGKELLLEKKIYPHRNAYNKLKHTAKSEDYQQELNNKYKSDVRKTWILYRKLIGKLQDKSAVPDHFFFFFFSL